MINASGSRGVQLALSGVCTCQTGDRIQKITKKNQVIELHWQKRIQKWKKIKIWLTTGSQKRTKKSLKK
jgi:hypothetical protein